MAIYEKDCFGVEVKEAIERGLGDRPTNDKATYIGDIRLSYQAHSMGLSISGWESDGTQSCSITFWHYSMYYHNKDIWPKTGSPVSLALDTLVSRLKVSP